MLLGLGDDAVLRGHREAWTRAARPAEERLWVGLRVRGGGEPAHARPSGRAGGTHALAQAAQAAGDHAPRPTAAMGFLHVLLRFAVGSHVCVSVVCREYVVTMMLSSE